LTELENARLAFVELGQELPEWGWVVPRITFVIAQNNTAVVFAPEGKSWEKVNVPSGTCVDEPGILLGASDDCSDFFLVPHGGLKGTSKPVYYRIVADENNIGKSILAEFTYNLSFQYGTATKATRAISVCQYSNRICNSIQGNLPYLFETKRAGVTFQQPDPLVERPVPYYTSSNGDPRVFSSFSQRAPFHTHLAC
jgi:hypothetical protein